MAPSRDPADSPCGRREGVSRYILGGHMNSNMTVDVALVTLKSLKISDATLFRSVEVVQKFSCSTLKSEKQRCHAAPKPPLFRSARAAINGKKTHGLSPESQHAEADHERRASRAAPRGQARVSQVTPSWQLRVGPLLCRST